MGAAEHHDIGFSAAIVDKAGGDLASDGFVVHGLAVGMGFGKRCKRGRAGKA